MFEKIIEITYSKETSNRTLYSDRLYQWNPKKYRECCQKIWKNNSQYFDIFDGERIEKFLQLYYPEYNLVLIRVKEESNISNGYPYWKFEVKMDKKERG